MMVEYYRCWDDNTWDTGFIEIPDGTPENEMDNAIRTTVRNWQGNTPAFVGLYHYNPKEQEQPKQPPLVCNHPLFGTGEIYRCLSEDCPVHGDWNKLMVQLRRE